MSVRDKLINNLLGADARQHAKLKHDKILSFLREDIYTVPEVIQDLCNIGDQAAAKTLRQMVKAGLLKRSIRKHIIFGGYRHVWGITAAGIERSLLADDLIDYWDSMDTRAFGESMVRKDLNHLFGIQRARAEALNNNCGEWSREQDLGWCFFYDPSGFKKLRTSVHRPDGVASIIKPDGHLFTYAVEVEIEVKSAKNYRSNILPGHYRNIAEGRYDAVYYYRDNLTLCENLRRKLFGIALGKPVTRDARGRPLPRSKQTYSAVDTVFEFASYDDSRASMNLTPEEAFNKHIKFCDFEGNELGSITEEEWSEAYSD